MSYRGVMRKTLLTCVGYVTVGRRYYACRDGDCGCKLVPWDTWSGIPDGHKLTVQARRMVTLAGSDCSFDQASDTLRELCRLEVSNDVIRRVCNEEGEEARRWIKQAPEPVELMAQAEGDLEFYCDGVMVNTVDGWREMRVSALVKRLLCGAAEPAQWDDRVLEEPACRVAWAAIAASNVVGASWDRMMKQLGLENTPHLSVLADGARWIWDEAAKRFRLIVNVDWTVDVYHVSEHVHAAAQKMFGAHTKQARQWGAARMEELISLEGPRFIERLREEQLAAGDQKCRDALDGLIGYLSQNRDSLWYRTRLAEGRTIGSGLIEGSCKNMIQKRLKLNNARWRVRRAEHMAAIRCLRYSEMWEIFWAAKTPPLKVAA